MAKERAQKPKINLPPIFFLWLTLLCSCATIPAENRPQVREKLITIGDQVVAEFLAADPAIKAAFHKSKGYFVGDASMGMYGLMGFGGSVGVLYDKQEKSTTFLNINTLDFGLGVAGSDIQALVLFNTAESLEEVKSGFWTLRATSASMVGPLGDIARADREGWTVYVRSKSGLAVGGAITLAKVEINTELTEVGLTEVGVPNMGLANRDQQGETAPRKWNRVLPFLAQKVVDKGFDLPLPWGLGLTAVGIDQKMELTELSAGFNSGPMREFPSVSLNDPETRTRSIQVKLDAWLLPFMNVFALAGMAKGDFKMNVGIDGNTILDELGESCGGPIPSPLCIILQDNALTLPIETEPEIFTYGGGTTLAAGWNNWFLALPMSATWIEPKGSVAEGTAYTITPRIGRIVNLGKRGNIAGFMGGNWLQSKYTITGTFKVPDADLNIDYSIDQESKDSWTLLLGFNWNFNRRTSWAFEYNGFIGSRQAIISSFNARF